MEAKYITIKPCQYEDQKGKFNVQVSSNGYHFVEIYVGEYNKAITIYNAYLTIGCEDIKYSVTTI